MAFAFPITHLHWWLGLVLVSLACIYAALHLLERRRQSRLTQFVDAGLAKRLMPGYDAAVRRPLRWLALLGFALLALAFAQPQWGQAWQDVRGRSRDVLVCLDTSESMRASDLKPDRLTLAQRKIASLLDKMPGDRFGLAAFSGAAAVQCPLTLDHAYFKAVLNAVDTDTISREGTNIEEVLREALDTFKRDAEETGNYDKNARALLLISDGEQVAGDVLRQATQASEYARIYVIGVGNPEGAIVRLPEWMSRAGKYNVGKLSHVSKLGEDALIRLAQQGGGRYVRATIDNVDVDMIREHMEELATHATRDAMRYKLVNRYQWPLALAIGCFLAEGAWLAAMPWVRKWRMSGEERFEEVQHA